MSGLEILHNEAADSVVIADAATHDDIAEMFHNERHTVAQTVEHALETARYFIAARDLHAALIAAKQEMWLAARHQWTMADFNNWAVIQQINAALQKADGKERVSA